jgi:YkoY family integral membrane protein
MPFDLSSQDLALIGVLVFLEGVLSVDNALVLAMLSRHLPQDQRRKALTYGMAGAFLFRLIALSMVSLLQKSYWVKFAGGGYLLYIAIKHLFFGEKDSNAKHGKIGAGFWRTVVAIELTDIAFAVDSILAGVALTPKIWIVFTGGVIGIVVMRFAASAFIKLIEKFPGLEKTAYLLVLVIGLKVVIEGFHLPGVDFHSATAPAFWIFWSIMAVCIAYGFWKRPAKGEKKPE